VSRVSERRRTLEVFDEEIARRARLTNEAHPWWPCRSGCDGCCRRLADVPKVSEEEWDRLAEGIAALDPVVRASVHEGLDALDREPPREGEFVTCPMLDRTRGTCLVYEHRPAACRSYGYYVRRDDVLACNLVTSAVAERTEEVVWGNHLGLEDDLARRLGEARPITAWRREKA
jgi:uncharacterized protein